MARKLTLTLTLDIKEDSTDEDVQSLLNVLSAQVEDDESGVIESYELRAPGIPGWDRAAGL